MVDCRPVSGAPPAAPSDAAPPVSAPSEPPAQPPSVSQVGGAGETCGASPASTALVPVPQQLPPTNTYPGGMGGYGPGGGYGVCGAGGMKGGVLLCGPPPPPAPTIPHNVNPNVHKSMQPNGSDLPMNDIPTLRFFFNLGVEYMWAGGCVAPPLLPPPPPPVAQHRYYAPVNDLAQEMQQGLSLHERPTPHNGDHKPPGKGSDKNAQGKGQQRPLIAPRFNRGNGEGGNHGNHSHHNNKNNYNNNKGRVNNNRRTSHGDMRGAGGEGECGGMEPVYTVPYMPYTPHIQYFYHPVEADPNMMGMMGGYMGYGGEELGEPFPPPLPHYYQPYPPPPPPHIPPPPHHHEHK